MGVIKVACLECGQKVSGDEAFYGRSVDCPICSAKIRFPVSAEELEGLSRLSNEAVPSTQTALSPKRTQDPPRETLTPLSKSEIESRNHDLPPPPKFDSESGPLNDGQDEQAKKTTSSNPASLIEEEEQTIEKDSDVPSPMFGILSTVFGSITLLTACHTGILFAPIAAVLGHLALAKAKKSPIQPAPGKTTGLVGAIMGYIGMIGFLIVLSSWLFVFRFNHYKFEEKAKSEIEAVTEKIEQQE